MWYSGYHMDINRAIIHRRTSTTTSTSRCESSLSTDCGSTRSFRTKSIGNQVLFKKTMQHWESFRAGDDTQLLAVFTYSRRLLDIVGCCTMFYQCVSADPSYVYLSKCDERTHRYYFLIYDFIDRESDL